MNVGDLVTVVVVSVSAVFPFYVAEVNGFEDGVLVGLGLIIAVLLLSLFLE